MFQKLKSLWNHPEWKRILTVTALLLVVIAAACGVQEGLRSRTAQVKAGESRGAKLAQTKYKAASMSHMKRMTAILGIRHLGGEASQETGMADVQSLTAEEAAILPGQYPIMGESSIKIEQMVTYFNTNGGNYPSAELGGGGAPDIETFCKIYYEESLAEGVRPEVAFAQTMKETGWLQYGGDASISQYNFAGLGTTGGGVPGNNFPDVRTGVRAQIQHLKAYATDKTLSQECVDDRYTYVTKGCAPYVEWLGQNENPEGFGWATGLNYGYDIVDMIHAMRSY